MHWADDMVTLTENDLGLRRLHRPRHAATTGSFGPFVYCNYDMAIEITGTFDDLQYIERIHVLDPASQIPYSLKSEFDPGSLTPDYTKVGMFNHQVGGTMKSAHIGEPGTYDENPAIMRRDPDDATAADFFKPSSGFEKCVVEDWGGVEFEFDLILTPTQDAWTALAEWNETAYDSSDPLSDPSFTTTYLDQHGFPGHSEVNADNTHLLGRLTRIGYPDGRYVDIRYKDEWTPIQLYSSWERHYQIDTITASSGEVLTFTYLPNQQSGQWVVSSVTNSDGQTASYSYSNGHLSGVSRSDGTQSTISIASDALSGSSTIDISDPTARPGHRNKKIYVSNLASGTGTYFSFPVNMLKMIENGEGEVAFAAVQLNDYSQNHANLSNYTYHGGGRLARLVPAGNLNFSAFGSNYFRMVADFEPGWEISVDANNEIQVSGTEQPATIHHSSDKFQSLGNQYESTVESSGKLVFYEYENGWVVRAWYTDDSFEAWCRDEDGRVTRYRDRNGNVRKFEYAECGGCKKMLVGLTDHPSNEETQSYYSQTRTYDRCATNDVVTSEYAVYQWEYEEDYNGLGKTKMVSYTDPLGNKWECSYNNDGLLSRVDIPNTTAGSGQVSSGYLYTYTTNGQLKKVVSPEGDEVEYIYDSKFRLISTLYDDASTETIEYFNGTDGYSLPSRKLDRNGTLTTFVYDGADSAD
ncbi:hypothetical protein U8335_13645 [Roseiconus lacunae]|uniref:hypothetical protein n=1 Tax=Roseiconus lacunae TaxID=2605694 RepID=UPI00308A4C6E|nr:hypothetical protein U8335_13645 [Stieleria sp. HD01]